MRSGPCATVATGCDQAGHRVVRRRGGDHVVVRQVEQAVDREPAGADDVVAAGRFVDAGDERAHHGEVRDIDIRVDDRHAAAKLKVSAGDGAVEVQRAGTGLGKRRARADRDGSAHRERRTGAGVDQQIIVRHDGHVQFVERLDDRDVDAGLIEREQLARPVETSKCIVPLPFTMYDRATVFAAGAGLHRVEHKLPDSGVVYRA